MANFNPLNNYLGGLNAGQAQLDRRTEADEKRLRGLAAQLGEQSSEYKELLAKNPESAMKLKQAFSTDDGGLDALIDDSMSLLYHLETDPSGDSGRELLQNRIQNTPKFGGRTSKHSENLLNILNTQGVDAAIGNLKNVHKLMAEAKDSSKKGTKQIEFDSLVEIAEGDPTGETIKGKAALMDLGIMAKASKTAAERIAESPELERLVAEAAKNKAQATEEGKSSAQLKFKPQIQSAIKIAEAEASARGEALTDLSKMQASMPGLESAVSQLRELSEISTSTLGGRFFDTMVKETGFGATKGGTARAKIIAIINNQMLPLLKQTFGGAMTEGEGKRLAATMGDPDQTHEGRMAELDAFIDQKRRTISGLKNEVGKPVGEMSEEELFK